MPLTPLALLTNQLKTAHQAFLGTLDQVSDDIANQQPAGSALSIAAIWIHEAISEDMFLSMLTGKPLLQDTTFATKTGASQPHPMAVENWAEAYAAWAKTVQANTSQLLEYTKAAFSATEAYLDNLNPDQLEETKNMGAMGGQMSIADIISSYLIGHCQNITGEISALKGTQGLKGYPW